VRLLSWSRARRRVRRASGHPPGFEHALRIVNEGVYTALKKVMKGKKELLPAIAGLGLTGYLLRAGGGDTEPSGAY
jgi:hypothetical protein